MASEETELTNVEDVPCSLNSFTFLGGFHNALVEYNTPYSLAFVVVAREDHADTMRTFTAFYVRVLVLMAEPPVAQGGRHGDVGTQLGPDHLGIAVVARLVFFKNGEIYFCQVCLTLVNL